MPKKWPKPKPKPQPLPPVPLQAVAVRPDGVRLKDIVVSLEGDVGGAQTTDAAGWAQFLIDADKKGKRVLVKFAAPAGYAEPPMVDLTPWDGQPRLSPNHVEGLMVPTAPPVPDVKPISALHTDGLNFRNANGQIVKVHGVTAFKAPQLALDGELGMLDDYMGFSREMLVNFWREFGSWGVTNFDPRRYGNYYDVLHDHGLWLNKHGVYLDFCAFATREGDPAHMSTKEQDEHVARCREALSGVLGVFVVWNEPYNNGNCSVRFAGSQFSGLVSARGTAVDGSDPRFSGDLLNFTTRHPPRNDEFERGFKVLLEDSTLGGTNPDKTGWKSTGQPCFADEPKRIAEGASRRQWADFAAGADLHGAGMVIHGGNPTNPEHGSGLQYCVVPTGEALEQCKVIAKVWADGGIPLDANAGEYSAGHLGNRVCQEAGALKSYAQIQGNKATLLRVRETGKPEYANGWREVARRGPDGQIVEVTR